MSERTYSVYLIERHGEQGGKREVTSPVQGHELEFYDSGVWLNRETGRNFFPYRQIRTIREHPEGNPAESESQTSREGESGSGNRTTEEGDGGAEEEMLE
ncbi:hypothetical protein [Halorussus aquaticus]|uniref:Uncharacterized protein n=1 Tax=Halorussus aquaticus TaxID=2953748 RepID=A0ABD5Q4K0_9EURY|nr:hypothetical protein [Halorussus aquaticus]